VSSGGNQTIGMTGVASATNLLDGGRQYVSAGGTTSGTKVRSGASASVAGTAIDTTVFDGGMQTVSSGGTANSTEITSGGKTYVALSGTLVDAELTGGTILLSAGAIASGIVNFNGAGLLRIADSDNFIATISGLSDDDEIVDLMDIDFSKATLGYSGNTMSGILTISDGMDTAQLRLIGQYTAANFHMASNGAGGTLVWDPPVVLNDQHALANPR